MNRFPLNLLAGVVLILCGLGQTAFAQQFDASVLSDEAASEAAAPAPTRALRTVRSAPVTSGPALRPPDMAWVENTLAQMTLDEKIGQMIMPGYSSSTADSMVTSWRVGGFIFQGNSNTASAILTATNHLQEITSVPLIFSVDCEAGLGARVVDATRFPLNMGAAATRRTDLAQQQGGVTARECRAVGIQIGFGPVLDVNTEPVNPIIGVRSYSDKASLVAQMAGAYVAGANAEGLLCTYKHFPGHGATTGDSHQSFQTVTIPISELESVHVAPYRTLIGLGTGDLVMSAHVWYTQLDPTTGPDALPATLSWNALTGILRNELGFGGTVISDSFGMAGLQQITTTYEGVTSGVLAGLDIILTPPSITDAFNGLKDAVSSGTIPMSRIDASVRRILVLKSRAGMPETTTVSATAMSQIMGHPDNLAVAKEIGDRAVCQARVQPGTLPLTTSQSVLVLNLTQSSTIFYFYDKTYFNNALSAALPGAVFQSVATSLTNTQINNLVSQAQGYDRVVVTSHDWKPTISTSQQNLVSQLLAANVNVIYCDFGSPYQISQWPTLQNFYCAFSTHYDSQAEMARILTGQSTPQGQWPVTVAGVAETPVTMAWWELE